MWLQSCAVKGMQPNIHFSRARRHVWGAIPLMLLAGFMGLNAKAADIPMAVHGSPRALSFARGELRAEAVLRR